MPRFTALPLAFAALAILAGCGAPEGSSTPDTPGHEAAAISATKRIDPPDFTKRSAICLVGKDGSVKVGDEWEHALSVFRQPPGAFQVTDLPPGLNDPDYRVDGWDTTSEGFGVVLFTGKVALALYQKEKAQELDLEALRKTYTDLLDAPVTTIGVDRVRYYFWSQGSHRLMICALRTDKGDLNISISMGDRSLMDALKMSESDAQEDVAKAEAALSARHPAPAPKP